MGQSNYMRKFLLMILVIQHYVFPGCVAQDKEKDSYYVTRYLDYSFGSTLLCTNGTQIHITKVYSCEIAVQGNNCNITEQFCAKSYQEDSETFQNLSQSCNGHAWCEDSYVPSMVLRECGEFGVSTAYTTLEYQCLQPTVENQESFYHGYSSRCSNEPFSTFRCPQDTYINVTSLMMGESRTVPQCSVQAGDCIKHAQTSSMLQAQVACNGKQTCEHFNATTSEMFNCSRGNSLIEVNADYDVLLYQCLRNETGVVYTCLTGTVPLTGAGGTVTSPAYPGDYYNNTDCGFFISVSQGYRIILSFEDFVLEDDEECEYDYLEVYDGEPDKAGSLGKYCNDRPGLINSTDNKMFIKFYSDTYVSKRGFKFHWYLQEIDDYMYTCQDTITEKIQRSSGVASSQGYPSNYRSFTDCGFLITVPVNHIVNVTWLDMGLEADPECDSDYVTLYDGSNAQSPVIGRYCGDEVPGSVTTSANTLLILFHTDVITVDKGFQFYWTSTYVEPVTTEATIEEVFTTTVNDTQYATTDAGIVEQQKFNTDLILYVTLPLGSLILIALVITIPIAIRSRRKKHLTDEDPISHNNPEQQMVYPGTNYGNPVYDPDKEGSEDDGEDEPRKPVEELPEPTGEPYYFQIEEGGDPAGDHGSVRHSNPPDVIEAAQNSEETIN